MLIVLVIDHYFLLVRVNDADSLDKMMGVYVYEGNLDGWSRHANELFLNKMLHVVERISGDNNEQYFPGTRGYPTFRCTL